MLTRRLMDALVAQLVEHLICNQGVTSSNLVGGTTFRFSDFRHELPSVGNIDRHRNDNPDIVICFSRLPR